ncbi:hypothetical protein [Faecalibacter sp. LW9]|uniref:hypothetical protein n=1 Tax=Faecalibacter sp. LW9 TaxID=3103144 RepID=UPI002AFFB288|nr:hypothetical protein [Faecalibacter sp. LW9]
MWFRLLSIWLLLLVFTSCSTSSADYKIEVASPTKDVQLKLFYQDNYIDNYTEEKSIQSTFKNSSYSFEIMNASIQRIRLDFDNLQRDSVIVQNITLSRDTKKIKLEGKDLKDFFMLLPTIEGELLNDNSLLLKITDKEDPYIVSKNLNLLW